MNFKHDQESFNLRDTVELIDQAKAGSPEALNALFSRYASRALSIVRLRLGTKLRSRLESQDIVQESFLRAYRDFDNFEYRQEGAFIHWLSRLIENTIRDQRDYQFAAKRHPRHFVAETRNSQEGEIDSDFPGLDLTPSQELCRREDIRRLEAALDELSEEHREVILQRDCEGLSFIEIAQNLGRSPDAGRMLYARAKAKLVVLMEADGDGYA